MVTMVASPSRACVTRLRSLDDNHVVRVKDYLELRKDRNRYRERFEDILLVSVQKETSQRRRIERLQRMLTRSELSNPDEAYLSLRRLEDKAVRLGRLIDGIKRDFKESGMSPDQVMEGMTLLSVIVDGMLPDMCLTQLFNEDPSEERQTG